jgi:hypothetical protein
VNIRWHISRFLTFWNLIEASGRPVTEVPVWRIEEMIREAWMDGHRQGIRDVQDVMREEQQKIERRASK